MKKKPEQMFRFFFLYILYMGVIYLTTNNINNKKYIGVDTKNNKYYFGSGKAIKLAIKKYGIENFSKEILEESDDANYLFEKEKYYIKLYDAINSKNFYNIAEGEKGGAGTLKLEESKEKHRLGSIKISKINVEKRKGKTYIEIYGEDRAKEEKEKRRIAGLGKTFSVERINKISQSLKGKSPWNKGLDKSDKRVQKSIDNRESKKFIKKYILITPDCCEIVFEGKKQLKNYLKQINSTLKHRSRINIVALIKNNIDKNYKLQITKAIHH